MYNCYLKKKRGANFGSLWIVTLLTGVLRHGMPFGKFVRQEFGNTSDVLCTSVIADSGMVEISWNGRDLI